MSSDLSGPPNGPDDGPPVALEPEIAKPTVATAADASLEDDASLRRRPPPGGPERILQFSIFANKFQMATDEELPWPEFVLGIEDVRTTRCTIAVGKDQCKGAECKHKNGAAWSGAIYGITTNRKGETGKNRCKRGAIKSSILGFDLDHVAQETVDAVADRIRELRLAGVIHGSHNDGRPPPDEIVKGPRSVRVILRPSRDILPSEWTRARAGAMVLLGVPPDDGPKGTGDISRLFYLPSRPKDGPPVRIEVFEGVDLDVDECIRIGSTKIGSFETDLTSLAEGAPTAKAGGLGRVSGQTLDAGELAYLDERLRRLGPAVEGSPIGGGHKAVIAGAIIFNDFDATDEQGFAAALRWNEQNEPPWIVDDSPEGRDPERGWPDLEGKLLRGADAAENALGCALKDFAIMVGLGMRTRTRAPKRSVQAASVQVPGASKRATDGDEEEEAAEDNERPPTGYRKKNCPIGVDIDVMADLGRGLLTGDPDVSRRLYQHGDEMVQVASGRRPDEKQDAEKEDGAAPRIRNASVVDVMARMSALGRWTEKIPPRGNRPEEKRDAMPPRIVAERIISSGSWNLPPLVGVSERPILRPDGTIVNVAGYDPQTGLYLLPSPDLTGIKLPSGKLSRFDAEAACWTLFAPFQQFPFEKMQHGAALVAFICSVVCRSAVAGTVPFFSFEAPQATTGKTLLVDAVSIIATGHVAARMTARNEEEEPKRILPILLKGTELALIDNIARRLGSEHWDSLGTSMLWTDRELGLSRMRTVPARCIWCFTGNNIQLAPGDMGERLLRCYMDAKMAHPGKRDFDIDLLAYVKEHRAELVAAAMTIVAAYIRNDRPLPREPNGKYPTWNVTVRSAIEWSTGVDPWGIKDEEEGSGDPKADAQKSLVRAWYAAFDDEAKTSEEAIASTDKGLRSALEGLCMRDGKITVEALGYALRSIKNRTFEINRETALRMESRKSGDNRWLVRRMEVRP